MQWSTKKTEMGWVIDITHQFLPLPITRRDKLAEVLAAITNKSARVLKKKCHRILEILRIAVPEIVGEEGIFSRLQSALKTADFRRVKLTSHVQNELNQLAPLSQLTKGQSNISQRDLNFPLNLDGSDSCLPTRKGRDM